MHEDGTSIPSAESRRLRCTLGRYVCDACCRNYTLAIPPAPDRRRVHARSDSAKAQAPPIRRQFDTASPIDHTFDSRCVTCTWRFRGRMRDPPGSGHGAPARRHRETPCPLRDPTPSRRRSELRQRPGDEVSRMKEAPPIVVGIGGASTQAGDGGYRPARSSSQGGQEDDSFRSLSTKIATREYYRKTTRLGR